MAYLIGIDGQSQTLKTFESGSPLDFLPAPDTVLVGTWALWANGANIILFNGFGSERMQHFDGGVWTDFPLPAGVSTMEIMAYAGLSYNSVYAVGRRNSSHSYVMHWNGSTWSTLFEFASGKRFEQISMTDDNNIWVVADGSVVYEVYRWNGSSVSANHWPTIEAMDPYLEPTIRVHTESATETYLFCYRNEPWITDRCEIYEYDGATWSYVRPLNPAVGTNPHVEGLIPHGGNVYLMVNASNAQRIVEFTPAADTTEWLGGDYRYVESNPFAAGTDVFAAMHTQSGTPTWGIILERDGGGTWSTVANSTANQWLDVGVLEPSTHYQFQSDETASAAATVTQQMVVPSAGVVAYQALGAFGPALWKWSLASGWIRIADPPRNIFSMCAHSEYDLWLAANTGSGLMELYHYDGFDFQLQTLPGNSSSTSNDGLVRFWDESTVYYLGQGNGPRGLWRTTTGGHNATWTLLSTDAWLLSAYEMVVVGPDEVYLCGSSGAAPGGKVGVGYWSPGTGFILEDEGTGLTKYDPEISNNQRFVGMTWDQSNPNELWLIDTGAGFVVGSKLYKGKIGGPWTLAIRFDSSFSYTSRYVQNGEGRAMVMDRNGVLFLSIAEDGVDPDVILAGDPRDTQPSLTQVANPSTGNLGRGDKWTFNDYVLMSDNGKSMFYIPGTGWTVPTVDAGNYYAQALVGVPAPEYVVAETATAVDTVTVTTTSIPPSDDEWVLLENEQWIKPDQDPPKPDPDRAAYYGGGSSAIAWDARRRRVVLLTEPTTIGILQAWDYIPDSNAWVQREPFGGMADIHYPTSASKDLGLAACFDGVANQTLIYALSKTTGTPTLWHWDASRITKLAPVGMPTVEEPQLVWDENRQSCWLYGYSPSSGQPYELFEYLPSLATFVDRYVLHAPGNFPAGRRRGCGLAFDPKLNELVLTHGGIEPTLYADTWSFNPATSIWTNRTPSGSEGVEYPERRTRTALVTGPDEELFLVGGYTTGEARLHDTWRWEGDVGTWTSIPPNSVMITDVNANMRVIGRYPPRIVVQTQPRIGIAVQIGQANEVVMASDSLTVELA